MKQKNVDYLNSLELKIPIGIGISMWHEIFGSNYSIELTLLHGHNQIRKNVTISQMMLCMDEEYLSNAVQLLIDTTVMELLHHLDNIALKQPIIERLQKALETMKYRAKMEFQLNNYLSKELWFFIDYLEGYVLQMSSEKRSKPTDSFLI